MKIGWIGMGVMGNSMAGHLQNAGYELYIYSRTKQKAQGLLGKGAQWCRTPAEVSHEAEITFTIVGYPRDVEEVYLGTKGLLTSEGFCKILVDMSTSQPILAQRIAAEAEKVGVQSLDAPVSGGDIGARNATLAIMVGGKKETFEKVLPLFKLMGQNILLMGGPGAGQHTKMCNQILIAGTMIGVCESLLYAVKVGLDQQAVIEIIGKGAAGSWSINNLGPRIQKGDFNPGFFVEHFIKDMEIALNEATAASLSLPGLALVHQLYLALKAQGDGRCGTQALYKVLQRLNGQKPSCPA
jgi:3-hydroxyisobutyrate dehydrogenase